MENQMKRITNKRKKIISILIALVVLAGTGFGAYQMGLKQGQAQKETQQTKLEGFATKAKEQAKKKTPSTPLPARTDSSGYFRLSGTVQAVKGATFTLTLADNSMVTITTNDKTTYSDANRKSQPVSSLKPGAKIFAIGTISAKGTFTTSNIQTQ